MKFFHSSLPHTDGLLAPTDTLPATETDEQQKKCASLLAEKEELSKSSLKDKTNLQQLEKELASSLAQNAELSNSLIALERPQQELEKRLAALQLQHQQDSTKWQTQLDEADSRNMALQRERAWMTWGLAVAVTVMAVTAAALFRTPAPLFPAEPGEGASPTPEALRWSNSV